MQVVDTNRSIGGNAPSEYLGAILKKVDGLTEPDAEPSCGFACGFLKYKRSPYYKASRRQFL